MKANSKKSSIDKPSDSAHPKASSNPPHQDQSDHSEEMQEEELAAFNSIMREIESEPDAVEEASVSAGIGAVDESLDTVPDQSTDADLDEAQQKAFENIMAQIAGGNDQRPEDATEVESVNGEASEPEDDFSAELAKIAKEAEAVGDEGRPHGDVSSDAEPIEAQQKASDNIMAERDVSVAEDDFSSELEMVVQQGDTIGGEQKTAEADGDELDEDQRKAFESIMAQIQGDGKVAKNVDAEDAEQDEPVGNMEEDATELPSSDTTETISEEASPEESDDIEKILQEIAIDAGQSSEPDTAPDDPSFDVTDDAQDQSSGAIIQSGDGNDGGVENEPSKVIGDASSAAQAPEGKRSTVDSQLSPASERDGDAQATRLPPKTSPLREAGKSVKKSKWPRSLVAAAVLLLVVVAAYGYWRARPYDPVQDTTTAAKHMGPPDRTVNDVTGSQERADEWQPATEPVNSDQSRLTVAVEQLEQLRKQLIDKRSEVEELRSYYQAGIDAEIQEIRDAIHRTGVHVPSLKEAMADSHLSLGLSAIQRREAYIRQLVHPSDTLQRAAEELLYWSHKAALLSLMVGKTSDIDIDGYIAQATLTMDRHDRTLKTLNIDDLPTSPLAMETIWKNVTKYLPRRPAESKAASDTDGTNAADISQRICNGDYTDKHRLTRLSPQTARCLAQWKGKDLFLNALTDLPPDTARYLVDWQGDWLGLNGLKTLSPETAIQLARWKGKTLSLNGLTRLSPRVVAILSEWPGDQIELINVEFMAHWENPNTRLLLSEKMKHKLSMARN